MQPLNPDEIHLIKKAREGKDAFEQLVVRYQHDVYRISRIYTNNDSDAEDLAQETWVKVYRSLGKLLTLSRFPSWLFTITANTARDWLKSRAHSESQVTDEIESTQLRGSAIVEYQRQQLIRNEN